MKKASPAKRILLAGAVSAALVAAAVLVRLLFINPSTERAGAPAEEVVPRGMEMGPPGESVRRLEAAKAGSLLAAPHQRSVDETVEALRNEEPEESVRLLHQPSLYFFPGVRRGTITSSGSGMPLAPRYENWAMETILSNRRYRKVWRDLSSMAKKHAADLVSKQIGESLDTYVKKMEFMMRGLVSANRNYPAKPPVRTVVHEEDRADGRATLEGLRYQLLGLAMLSGNLELGEAKVAVDRLVEEALAQRKVFYGSKLPWAVPFVFLKNSGIYNRNALATAWLGTRPLPAEARATAATLGVKHRRIRLVPFDAKVTEYDAAMAILATPDASKGLLELEVVDSIDEPTFNKLLGVQDVPITAMAKELKPLGPSSHPSQP